MLPFVRMFDYGNVAPDPKPEFESRLQSNYGARYYLHTNGNLYWYGTGSLGQGGNGSLDGSTTWLHVNTNVERYWCGVHGTLAIKNDGSIWYTGTNYPLPQIGANTNGVWVNVTQHFTDFGVSPEDIKKVYISSGIVVLLNNGKWFYCGGNQAGMFGYGSAASVNNFTYSTIDNVIDISCSYNSTGLVRGDGTYWYAGYTLITGSTGTSITTMTQDTSISNAIMSSNTYQSSYIFLGDGSMEVGSLNGKGDAGVGNRNPVPMSTVVPNVNFPGPTKAVGSATNSAGASCVVFNNNKLYQCGSNTSGQCGVGSNDPYVTTFTEMDLSNLEGRSVKGFVRDQSCTFIIDEDNNLYTCGLPSLSTVVSTNIPTRVDDSLLPWKQL